MKANEAPEKIYMNWVNYPLEEIQVEYIRKDAFIEKACEFLDGCIPDYIDLKHANVDMNVDNKRFIEDFRNIWRSKV